MDSYDGFKYSLTESNGIDKTIGFALADSILINYESVMHSKDIKHPKIISLLNYMSDNFSNFALWIQNRA